VASALLTQTIARQAEGAPEEDVLIRATQAEIAHLAGTSRESASRFLATLERAGVVTLGRGKVTVHDPGRLRNYIH
jgi:CRP/FNR family transcriptional regulator, cyclic AMP receptor protein